MLQWVLPTQMSRIIQYLNKIDIIALLLKATDD